MKKLIIGLLVLISIVGSVWGASNADKLLLQAVREMNLSLLEEAISGGANLDYMDTNDKTVLMYATESQWYPGVKALLENGANVAFKNKLGQNAIMFACKYLDSETFLKIYVDSGISNINDADFQGKTALMYAIENQSIIAVNLLLKRGANVSKVDAEGNDAFIWAVKCNNENAVRRMMEKTINWGQFDNQGNNAFMAACEKGNLSMVRTMLTGNNAFDLNTKTQTGVPMLLWLIDKRKSQSIINYVMEYAGGYDNVTGMTDDFGNDIYYYAELRNNDKVLDRLDKMEEDYKRAQERRRGRKK